MDVLGLLVVQDGGFPTITKDTQIGYLGGARLQFIVEFDGLGR